MSIDSTKIQPGDRIWTVNHYKVVSIEHKADGAWYTLQDDNGKELRANAGALENAFHAVSKFKEEKKVSTTAMVDTIRQAGHGDFQVTFHKKIDEGELAEKIQNAVQTGEFGDNPKKRKRWMKDNHVGQKRVMKARLLRNSENEVAREEAGRIPVLDIENNGKRLIDTRTIVEVVSEGVRYVRK